MNNEECLPAARFLSSPPLVTVGKCESEIVRNSVVESHFLHPRRKIA